MNILVNQVYDSEVYFLLREQRQNIVYERNVLASGQSDIYVTLNAIYASVAPYDRQNHTNSA